MNGYHEAHELGRLIRREIGLVDQSENIRRLAKIYEHKEENYRVNLKVTQKIEAIATSIFFDMSESEIEAFADIIPINPSSINLEKVSVKLAGRILNTALTKTEFPFGQSIERPELRTVLIADCNLDVFKLLVDKCFLALEDFAEYSYKSFADETDVYRSAANTLEFFVRTLNRASRVHLDYITERLLESPSVTEFFGKEFGIDLAINLKEEGYHKLAEAIARNSILVGNEKNYHKRQSEFGLKVTSKDIKKIDRLDFDSVRNLISHIVYNDIKGLDLSSVFIDGFHAINPGLLDRTLSDELRVDLYILYGKSGASTWNFPITKIKDSAALAKMKAFYNGHLEVKLIYRQFSISFVKLIDELNLQIDSSASSQWELKQVTKMISNDMPESISIINRHANTLFLIFGKEKFLDALCELFEEKQASNFTKHITQLDNRVVVMHKGLQKLRLTSDLEI